MTILLLPFLLLHFAGHVTSSKIGGLIGALSFKPSRSSDSNDLVNALANLKTGRSFGHMPCIWYYGGMIQNPRTGNEFAHIEGLEFVRSFDQNSESPDYLLGCRDRNQKLLGSIKNESIGHSRSYISKKIFIYTPSSNHSAPLLNFRIRPVSPSRKIDHPFKVLHELVTIGALAANVGLDTKNSRNSNNRPDFNAAAVIQWPGGRQLSSTKLSIRRPPLSKVSSHNTESLEVTNFISGGASRKRIANIEKQDRTGSKAKANAIRSAYAKIGRFVSFAPPDSDLYGRTQEYYSIYANKALLRLDKLLNTFTGLFRRPFSLNGLSSDMLSNTDEMELLMKNANAVIVYRRYGECPPWFSPGGQCSVEMQGFQLPSLQLVPSRTLRLIDQLAPSFISDGIDDSSDPKNDLLSKYKPWYSQLWPF